MSDDTLSTFTVAVSMGIIGLVLGIHVGRTEIKKEAIRAGAAYYTNDASGKPQFKWKEAK